VPEAILKILREQSLCVLCTVHQEEPHCSLMSYAVSADCREMYMLTSKDTRKYSNLRRNARVSLLVDTRTGGGSPLDTSMLSISGEYRPFASDSEQTAALSRLLERRPHLQELSEQPAARTIRIILKSFLWFIRLKSTLPHECP